VLSFNVGRGGGREKFRGGEGVENKPIETNILETFSACGGKIVWGDNFSPPVLPLKENTRSWLDMP